MNVDWQYKQEKCQIDYFVRISYDDICLFDEKKNQTIFLRSVLNGVNRRSVDKEKNRSKTIDFLHISQTEFLTIEILMTVYTTAETVHYHYDLQKPGYRGIVFFASNLSC